MFSVSLIFISGDSTLGLCGLLNCLAASPEPHGHDVLRPSAIDRRKVNC